MEEDSIAVSICILIIIASAILRRQETAQGMGMILDMQTRLILHSPFIDKRIVFREPRIVFRRPSREQINLFQPFLLLTLTFFTPLT